MKKFTKIAILLSVIAAMTFAVMACASASNVEIEEVKLSQTVFVQGEDPVFAGKIKVITEDATEVVDMTAEGVTVTGFDKNKPGEQAITVSYGGGSKSVTVNVVPRIVADNYESKYFVGEQLDTSKGRIKITRNDGTTFAVPMNDDAVSYEFDSSTAASPAKVAVRYQNGGDSYSGAFDVTVYAVEESTLNKPNKTAYKSHEAGLDLSGGYLYLKNGEYQKAVVLAPSMVSGFDLSAATDANRKTPLEQRLTVKYASTTLYYDIKITYSDVSYIRQSVSALNGIDWSGDALPAIAKAQGDAAIEAMRLYLDLSDADKVLVTAAEQTAIVRAATVYGMNLFETETVNKYSDVFDYATDGMTGAKKFAVKNDASNTRVKAAYDALGENTALSDLATLLADMQTAYEGYKFFGELAVDAYLAGATGYDETIANLGFALELYETVKDVPADWTVDNVTDNVKLEDALDLIESNDNMGALAYTLASAWRKTALAAESEDLSDILYAYCYKTDNAEMLSAIAKVQPPAEVAGFMMNVYIANIYSQIPGSIMFMSSYLAAEKEYEKLAASDDEILVWICETLKLENSLLALKISETGYFARMGIVADDAAVDALWVQYADITDKFMQFVGEAEITQEKFDAFCATAEFKAAVPAMFQSFIDLMPTQRMGFLLSLDMRYSENAGQGKLFFLNNEYNDYFPMFVGAYYDGVLSENAFEAFCYLALATECQSLGLSAFDTYLGKVSTLYIANDLGNDDTFAAVNGIYQKLLKISAYKDKDIANLFIDADYASSNMSLKNVFDNMDKAFMFMATAYQNKAYSAVVAAFETVEQYVSDIMNSTAQDVKDVFSYQKCCKIVQGGSTYENMYYGMRSTYIALVGAYSDEWTPELKKAFADSYFVMYTTLLQDASFDTTPATWSKVNKAMTSFRALDKHSQMLFLSLDGYGVYHGGLLDYFDTVFASNDKAKDVAQSLVYAEMAYVIYANDPAAEDDDGKKYSDAFKECMQTVESGYATLTDAEKKYLSDMYAYYHEKYEELLAATETPVEPQA